MTTTAQIRSKKTGGTGFTEELVQRLADAEGGELVAIVALKVDEVHKKVNGDRKVDLLIKEIEVADDTGDLDNHLRGIQAALFRNRKLNGAGDQPLPLDSADDVEPTVAEVLEKGRQFTPHEPLLGDSTFSDAEPTCDVCGHPKDHALHDTTTVVSEPDDEDF